MGSTASWWASRTRQFRTHLRARVAPAERAALEAWTSAGQRAVFDSMHVADRRHGLDVIASLRNDGATDPDILLAGLLHDAGKGDTGVGPRVAFTLAQRYGTWIWDLTAFLPGWRAALARLRTHAETSAVLAAAAACSTRTGELIRHQDAPTDPEYGEMLRLADEAN